MPQSEIDNYDQLPVTRVTAIQAAQFCDWIGRRLPTELEWERAARFTGEYDWPWGANAEKPEDHLFANFNYHHPVTEGAKLQAVGQAVQGKSVEGLYDLAGNAWEWTCTEIHAAPDECWDLLGMAVSNTDRFVVRGGGADIPPLPNMAYRQGNDPIDTDEFIGFRCVEDQ